MEWVIFWFGIALAVILLARYWLLRRESKPRSAEPFDGVVYQVGSAAIVERQCDSPSATVICMHGFVENLTYFTGFYDQPDVQLIAVNSCAYHLPIESPRFVDADWIKSPTAPEGSIEYDAQVLNQALEHLPKSQRVRVHGHSRGGALVLEAARQRSDLFQEVEVILEAPVLPQARPVSAISPAAMWFMGFLVPLWRRKPISRHNRGAWGPLEDERKRAFIEGLPFNSRRTDVMVANLRSMLLWMEKNEADIFGCLTHGIIIVPGKDRVLDVESMTTSAKSAARHGVSILEVEHCSHFVLLDRPDVFPSLGV
ncbi:MAG: alpha/beta hydrolase [unclassified Hahellaceae]|nr:alpha/beta hydrolase [Hahellaceae bacterium]|tara:strand:+ start:42109 stop:43044 length:936 start_codon:yes stop_codon:yes gene_type:complete